MKKLKINPVAKPRMTRSDAWKKRTCVTKYWDFKKELIRLFGENEITIKDTLHIEFHIPMPESWSKKKKYEKQKDWHDQKPDIDNLIKAVLDAILSEDCKVHSVYARKFWAKEGSIVILDSQEF
jgi:Holliday junction resolvase RusA-like endonuclease